MGKKKNYFSEAIVSLILMGLGALIHTAYANKKRNIIKKEDVMEEATYKYNFVDEEEEE